MDSRYTPQYCVNCIVLIGFFGKLRQSRLSYLEVTVVFECGFEELAVFIGDMPIGAGLNGKSIITMFGV